MFYRKGVFSLLKTFEEMCDGESICNYCSQTDYGEHKSYGTPDGQVFCEGTWCEDAYDDYLDEEQTSKNIVKYMSKVKLINKEILNYE